MGKDMNFEDALKSLEETVEKLGNRDMSIDDAIRLYEEGLKKCQLCDEFLNDANQKIEVYKK